MSNVFNFYFHYLHCRILLKGRKYFLKLSNFRGAHSIKQIFFSEPQVTLWKMPDLFCQSRCVFGSLISHAPTPKKHYCFGTKKQYNQTNQIWLITMKLLNTGAILYAILGSVLGKDKSLCRMQNCSQALQGCKMSNGFFKHPSSALKSFSKSCKAKAAMGLLTLSFALFSCTSWSTLADWTSLLKKV